MDRRRLHLLIFLLFLSCFAYFFNGGGGNQAARFNQTRAIVQRGTLYVDRIGFPSDDQILINGHTYSSKAPGTSLLGVPPFAILKVTFTVVGLKAPVWENLAVHLTTIATVGVPCALAGLALYLVLAGVGVSPPAALLGAVAITLGTTYFPYATMFFGHSLAGALAFLSFYLIWRAHQLRKAGEEPGRRVLYAALLIGWAVLTEYPLAIAAVLLSLYLLSTRPSRRELLYWVAGGGVAILVLLIYNWIAFGSPLALSYLNYEKSARNTFPVHGRGLGGVTAPRLEILEEILWGDARGILWFSPVLALVIPGLIYLFWRRRDLWREGLVVLSLVVGFLLFNAGYGDSIRYWGGANSAGPRHIIPAFPFAGLAIGLLVGAAPWLLVWLVLLSVAVCLAVTAVMPQVPMLYGQPFGQFIIPYFLEGRLSVHRGGIVSRKLVTEDSIAYNFGKLFGLPGSWSLLPLFLIVVLLGVLIFREMRKREELSARGFAAGLGLLALFLATLLVVPLRHQAAQAQPLEGPGVLARYYAGRECTGRPVLVTRERDLAFRWSARDIRPFPDTFCARWKARLKVDGAGPYSFKTQGGESTLRVDGSPVVVQQKGQRQGIGSIELTAGEHDVEIEAVITILSMSYEVRWRPGTEGPFDPVSPRLMSVPEAWIDAPDSATGEAGEGGESEP